MTRAGALLVALVVSVQGAGCCPPPAAPRPATTPPPHFELSFTEADDVGYIDADEIELMAARDQARAQVPRIRERFLAGLGPSRLFVKTPFDTEDDREWLWMEVTAWELDGDLHGRLVSQPRRIAGLYVPGESYAARQDEIEDWAIAHPDGTHEGPFVVRARGEGGQ